MIPCVFAHMESLIANRPAGRSLIGLPHQALKPRKIKIPEAVHYSKICRTELYELAKKHKGLFVKNGQATLVDVPILDTIIDGLPAADITD